MNATWIKGRRLGVWLVAVFLLVTLSPAARAEVKAHITLDESGNGTLTYNDTNAPLGLKGTTVKLQFEFDAYTIGPGNSFPGVLFYLLPNGFNVTAGDLLIMDGQNLSDVIRFFQPGQWPDPHHTGLHSIAFFSETGPADNEPDAVPPLADVGLPGNAGLFPAVDTHTATAPEVLEAPLILAHYFATGTNPSAPGGTEINQGTEVNYTFISDVIPEPATGMLAGMAVVGAWAVLRRRK